MNLNQYHKLQSATRLIAEAFQLMPEDNAEKINLSEVAIPLDDYMEKYAAAFIEKEKAFAEFFAQ